MKIEQRGDLGLHRLVAGDEDDRAELAEAAREGERARRRGTPAGAAAGSRGRRSATVAAAERLRRLLERRVEMSSSTGCTVRTTKGRRVKHIAIMMPSGV